MQMGNKWKQMVMETSLTLPGLARRSDKPSPLREASPRGSVGGGRASSRNNGKGDTKLVTGPR
eukprot:3513988-Pyramimonas_sp.AAC.1